MIPTPSLPYDGETAWGDVLNTYLNALSAEATSTQSGLQNHTANSPADPHGDRAYAQTLVSPFTTGLNTANGLVKLNGSGTIPPALITASSAIGGIYTSVVDAVAMFGVVAGTNTDQSAALQSAMNYVANLGGGIVYIGPGTFSVSSTVNIGRNTWVMMSPGTVIQRIPGSPNSPYIFSNIQISNTATPATNIKITGGTLNAVGSFTISTACTLVELFQGEQHVIDGVSFIAPNGNSHGIEINGASGVQISNCVFSGTPSNSSVSNSCILINSSTSSGSPTGLNPTLYTGQFCYGIDITNCNGVIPPNGFNYSSFGCLIGSDVSNSSSTGVQGLTVTGCGFESLAPNGPVYQGNSSWTYAVFSSNQWGDGKGTSNSLAANNTIPFDTWNQASLASGWSNVSGGYPLQYKISQNGTVTVFGAVNIPNSSPTSRITTLPYHPAHQVYASVSFANSTQAFSVGVSTSGQMSFATVPSGANNNPAFINFTFPADYSGNGTFT